MNSIPFKQFDGFLKQLAYKELPHLDQVLFEELFPLFLDDNSDHDLYEKTKEDERVKILAPLIEVAQPNGRSRR